jgi:serine/threonine protein kinase
MSGLTSQGSSLPPQLSDVRLIDNASKGGGGALPSFEESDFYLNIEDVQIGAQIGQGAFSKVYVGKYLGELVAVKKQKRAPADGLEAYLLRELAVLKHYEHTNLLSYIGASDVPGAGVNGASAIYIVTELAENGDLLGLLLGEHPLAWKLRVSILLDAARALEFLHSKMLIHRDIKSPNMLLDVQFVCKIADFGMARQVGANMTIVGTDAYMAPELMFDEPYGTSADMFSFGIVLWECIYRRKAGHEGFAERRPSDRFHLNAEDLHAHAPADTPSSLLGLAAQLCEYEPDLRPSAEDAFLWLEDLHNELDDDTEDSSTATASLPSIDYEHLFASAQPAAAASGTAAPTPSPPRPPPDTANAPTREIAQRPAAPYSDAPAAPMTATAMPPLPHNYATFGSSGGAGGGGSSSSSAVAAGILLGNSSSSTAALAADARRGSTGMLQPSIGSSSSVTSRSPSPGRLRGAAHAPITKCGYLHKKGKSGMKNWQKRWFVLEGTKLIWYKDSKQYPKEPRGFLELRGCFIVRGLFFRWKILNADGSADQEVSHLLVAMHYYTLYTLYTTKAVI